MRSVCALLVVLLCAGAAVDAAFYEKNSGVINLTSKNFDSTVKQDGQIFLVEFYAPWCGHCKSLQPEWVKAAKSLSGLVGVGALDCDDAANKPLAGKYGIKGFPTIKLFVGTSDKPKDYTGERTAKAITDWALGQIPSLVKKVTDKTVKDFFKSSPELPKALLFTKKTTTAPMFKGLSTKLKDRMLLAEIHEKEHKTLDQFGVSADDLPLLLAFPTKADGDSENDPSAAGIRYTGKLNSRPLYAWLRQYALPSKDDKEENAAVPELADQSCVQTLCYDEASLCAVAVLGGFDAAENAKYLELWKQAQLSREDSFFQFVWLNGTTHSSFIDKAFGMQPADYPQVVVLNAKKGKYTPFVGSFTPDSVTEFLESVLRGRGAIPLATTPLPSLPTDTKKCTPKPKEAEKPKADSNAGAGGAKKASNPSDAGVNEVLTAANFEKKVLNSKQPWIVEFFAPWCGHCKTLAPEWAKASSQLKNMVKFGAVDATVESSLASQFDVKGYPTIKYFPAGLTGKAKKAAVSDYQQARSAKALSDHALTLLDSKRVKQLSGGKDAFAKWASGTSAAPAGTGRVVLFSNKPTVPHLLSALSIEFDGEANFAFVKNTEKELVGMFNVTTFPSVFVLKAIGDPSANMEVSPIPSDHLSFNAISTLLEKFLGGRKAGASAGAGAAKEAPKAEAGKDKPKPVGGKAGAKDEGPVVTDPQSASEWQSLCVDKKTYCVVAVLNDAAAKPAGMAAVNTFSAVASDAKQSGSPYRFMRIQRRAQPELIKAMAVPESGAVNIVAINPKRSKFAVFNPDTAFESATIKAWLDDLTNANLKLSTLESVPPFANVPPAAPNSTPDQEVKGTRPATASEIPKQQHDEL